MRAAVAVDAGLDFSEAQELERLPRAVAPHELADLSVSESKAV